MAADPRSALRVVIAEKLHELECGCGKPGEPAWRSADAVLDMFPDVSVDGPPPFRFLLRSAPVAREDTDA